MGLKKKFGTAAGFPLLNRTVVFTGTLGFGTRKQASAIAHELGANVTRDVSGNTDYVVAGKDAGNKLFRAANKGTKIISEADFFAMVKKQRKAAQGM